MSDEIWDIKQASISLGGPSDLKGFMKVEIFNDSEFAIYFNEKTTGECDFFVDGIHLNAARRLRDFLNYAVP